jgi:hypothetical protein
VPERKEDVPASQGGGSIPWGLLGLAWLVPGLGHAMLGKKTRALVFAGVVVAAFLTGILLDGELSLPVPGSPFSWLKTFASGGTGLLFLGGRLLGLGHGDPTATGFDFGNTFLWTAGLMNWLVVLDVSDIARGMKG